MPNATIPCTGASMHGLPNVTRILCHSIEGEKNKVSLLICNGTFDLLRFGNVCLHYTTRYRCGAQEKIEVEEFVCQSVEVSGILTLWYLGIVVEGQKKSSYIGMEKECSWVGHGSGTQVLDPNLVASQSGIVMNHAAPSRCHGTIRLG